MDTADTQVPRFIAAVHKGEHDLDVRHIDNVYLFVFSGLSAEDKARLALLSDQQLENLVYAWQADLPTGSHSDIFDRIDILVENYLNLVQPRAKIMAEASDRNMDQPEIWEWIFARLPLTTPLANAISLMTDDERFHFACGSDPSEEGDSISALHAKFPEAGILDANTRINDIYTEGENCYFGMED